MMQPFTNSSHLIPDGAALAARMQRDGYLFLPGLLPRDDVTAVQRQVGEIARDAGSLRRDQPVYRIPITADPTRRARLVPDRGSIPHRVHHRPRHRHERGALQG